MSKKIETIGKIAVDAGIVIVGDPCYLVHAKLRPVEFGENWRQFANMLGGKKHVQIGRATAVVVGGFGGDGVYPVYVERDERGLVAAVTVRFDERPGL